MPMLLEPNRLITDKRRTARALYDAQLKAELSVGTNLTQGFGHEQPEASK